VSPRIDATEPLSIELSDFSSAILTRTPLVTSPELGLDVVRMIKAVDNSLASGGDPVSLAGVPAQSAKPLSARAAQCGAGLLT
jgi:hypothetical protein